MWAIFVYPSNNDRVRSEQWQELLTKKDSLGHNWVLGVDFNDIRHPKEKKAAE